MSDVHKITLQVKPPSKAFPGGKIIEGWYCVVDNAVVLTDREGKPLGGDKHHVDPGVDPKLVAIKLLRGRQSGSSARGFDARISYPKLRY